LEPARASGGHTARYNASTTTGAAAGATGYAARAGTGDEDGRRGQGPATTRKTGEGGDRRPPEGTGGAASRSPKRDPTDCPRKKRAWGRFVFFCLGSSGCVAQIERSGLDRPNDSAGAPAPIGALIKKEFSPCASAWSQGMQR